MGHWSFCPCFQMSWQHRWTFLGRSMSSRRATNLVTSRKQAKATEVFRFMILNIILHKKTSTKKREKRSRSSVKKKSSAMKQWWMFWTVGPMRALKISLPRRLKPEKWEKTRCLVLANWVCCKNNRHYTNYPRTIQNQKHNHVRSQGWCMVFVLVAFLFSAWKQSSAGLNAPEISKFISVFLQRTWVLGDEIWKEMLSDDGSAWPAESPITNPKIQLAALPFSSGTTGLPKGVMLSHFNLIANEAQLRYCIAI